MTVFRVIAALAITTLVIVIWLCLDAKDED